MSALAVELKPFKIIKLNSKGGLRDSNEKVNNLALKVIGETLIFTSILTFSQKLDVVRMVFASALAFWVITAFDRVIIGLNF